MQENKTLRKTRPSARDRQRNRGRVDLNALARKSAGTDQLDSGERAARDKRLQALQIRDELTTAAAMVVVRGDGTD
eukprot:scaffold16437_cov64-Isochrysis_galbana.AAC.3